MEARLTGTPVRVTPRGHVAVAVAICLLVWGGWMAWHLRSGYLVHLTGIDDAATYVECAQNVAGGQGMIHNQAFNRLEVELTEPMTWYPPGYSLLAAPLIKMGLSPWNAALAVAAISGAAFVVMLACVCASLFGAAPARRWPS